jgi:hypothetical protein
VHRIEANSTEPQTREAPLVNITDCIPLVTDGRGTQIAISQRINDETETEPVHPTRGGPRRVLRKVRNEPGQPRRRSEGGELFSQGTEDGIPLNATTGSTILIDFERLVIDRLYTEISKSLIDFSKFPNIILRNHDYAMNSWLRSVRCEGSEGFQQAPCARPGRPARYLSFEGLVVGTRNVE